MIELEHIKSEAVGMGACKLVDSIKSWKTLVSTIMSPQGVEFIEKHNDERVMGLFRAYKGHVQRFGIHVDSCRIIRAKTQCGAFIGKSTIGFAECMGTEGIYTYLVMDGAKLIVNAGKYAVVRLYNLGGSIEVNNDGTARILE